MQDEVDMCTILHEANMDGVKHLQSKNRITRLYAWAIIILIFVWMACFQIWSQIQMYVRTPVATNIEALYPKKILFPAVAICNNNQFRLTYITGPTIQNRRSKARINISSTISAENKTVFEKALENAWDMDAVKFLRNAAHWKSRMVLSCIWPNGSKCKSTDFKAVWTLSGLCWAINTDSENPHYVTASGSGNGLKLLLNIEKYERIESCSRYFKTKNLPGLKILIYNQTEIPASSFGGVNVPPGYTMDIPFRVQKRLKYADAGGCVREADDQKSGTIPFDHEDNIGTCPIRNFLRIIEARCNCSMIRAYNNTIYNFCNVDQYFHCVLPTMESDHKSTRNSKCLPACSNVDFIAWQDMNLLPNNILPNLIDTEEEEDVDDMNQNEKLDAGETFYCEEYRLLSEEQVKQIKRSAHRAFEKQSRYQDDIQLRTKRLISKLREATFKLIDLGWGWNDSTYIGAYQRLNESVQCYGEIAVDHSDVIAGILSPPFVKDEVRITNLYREYKADRNRYTTLNDLKENYGEQVDQLVKNMQEISNIISKIWKIYSRSTFKSTTGSGLERMDLILQLVKQYEDGRLQKRAWAEKMQSRSMRHFFEEDFYEGWYNPTIKDFEEDILHTIEEIEDNDLPNFLKLLHNKSGIQMGSLLYFGNISAENDGKFFAFAESLINCTMTHVRNETVQLLKSFKKYVHEFQSAYSNLFKKELPNYLINFDFDSDFVEQNFAMVNIFLHKMNVELWTQHSTYSIWSLACDIGGTLGLFLGASLLTIIELLYSCFHYSLPNRKCQSKTFWEKIIKNYAYLGIAKLNQRWLKKKSQEIIKKKDELEESAVESGLLENYEGEAYGQLNLNTPHFCNVTTYKFPHIDDKESEKNGSSILLESSYHADLMNETKSMDSSDYSPSTFYDTDVQESDRKTSDTSISHAALFLPKEERQSTV
ncbi:unnamed protein product [Dracunculus medinensis]|uniref:Amiloride-sensitive sodium channel n=1 Tax=Dracunculus medinensis TaxID=318479 RepID=A0A0N4UND2_DRAME|nr:unnamed protein product [Dracunculus medinensis]